MTAFGRKRNGSFGAEIAKSCRRFSDARNGFDNVALLDVAGSLARGKGTPPAVTWVTEERWEMSAGNFSPDGRWLTYSANVDGNGELYSYNPTTKRFFVPTFANEIYCIERNHQEASTGV